MLLWIQVWNNWRCFKCIGITSNAKRGELSMVFSTAFQIRMHLELTFFIQALCYCSSAPEWYGSRYNSIHKKWYVNISCINRNYPLFEPPSPTRNNHENNWNTLNSAKRSKNKYISLWKLPCIMKAYIHLLYIVGKNLCN